MSALLALSSAPPSRLRGAQVFPVSLQQPHPPLFMAAGTDRSMAYAARHGFGLMLSTLPSIETLARQVSFYRAHVPEAPAPLDQNPACGHVDVARWVYVAETDAASVSHLLHEAFLGMRSVLFWPES